MHRRGFTLVELLVVIGIMAVLIAILLPVLGKVQNAAKRVSCGAHLRSIAECTIMYAGEQHGWYPELHNDTGMWNKSGYADNVVGAPYWFSRAGISLFMQNYKLNRNQFYCPANWDWNTDANWSASSNGNLGSVLGYIYYGDNNWMSTNGKLAVTYSTAITAVIKYPVFSKRIGDHPMLQFLWSDLTRSYQPSGTAVGSFQTKRGSNHIVGVEVTTAGVPLMPAGSGGQNICYRDGHVEWTPQTNMARQWYSIDAGTGDITRGWW